MPDGFLDRQTFSGISGMRLPNEVATGVREAVRAARTRHERYITGLALTTALFGLVAIAWRIHTLEHENGRWAFAFVFVMAIYYGQAFLRGGGCESTRVQRWTRMFFEISSPAIVVYLDGRGSPVLGMTGGATYVFALAIAVSALRIDPLLSAAAGALAIVYQVALFAWLYPQMPAGDVASQPVMVCFRWVSSLMIAGVGVLTARTLFEKTAKIATEALREERIRAAFGSYVDERVVKRALDGELQLSPERRVVTIMFVDIRGFTTFSESRDPAQVFGILNETLNLFSLEVQKQGGIVNKFLGDGLMAIFGAPEEQPDHPRRAVRAALNIQKRAQELCDSGSFPKLQIGIGVHTGEVIVGDVGSTRREYTAIGDTVNVASRVEAANKELGTTILITEAVREAIGDGAELDAGPAMTLRGRTVPVKVYSVSRLEMTGEISRRALGAVTAAATAGK